MIIAVKWHPSGVLELLAVARPQGVDDYADEQDEEQKQRQALRECCDGMVGHDCTS